MPFIKKKMPLFFILHKLHFHANKVTIHSFLKIHVYLHLLDTSTTFCPLITQTLRIISVRCIPLSLRSKTRRRATLLLPTWICSCQSVGTVNFTLPFTTNVTISISILQTFRSWVATTHLRPPMAFLSHNSSDTPGLAPLMNALFWGRCDFPISFSGRDISRNVWNRL